jgi:hypothetical protein
MSRGNTDCQRKIIWKLQYAQDTLDRYQLLRLIVGIIIRVTTIFIFSCTTGNSVFRIRIHVFFGLPDLDTLVRGMDLDPALDPDPDPSIIMQK